MPDPVGPMTAVMDHSHEPSEQLAVEAASHPAPAIRILACEYFRRHPQPRNGYTILQLMNDADDRNVRLAAVKAAGFCRSDWVVRGGKPADSKPSATRSLPSRSTLPSRSRSAEKPLKGLEGLILSSDRTLQRAAVLSLSRLDHEFGFRELSRMSYDSNHKTREQAFRLMGETGKRRFVEVLVRRGWTERRPAVQRAILQSLEQITQPADRPLGLSRVSGYHAKIKLWAKALSVSPTASGHES